MKIEKQNELVLVFRSELMYGFKGLLTTEYPKELSYYGLSKEPSDLRWFSRCLNNAFFMPRGLVEKDPNYKQIIPYIVLKHGDNYFTYSRDGAETRLTGCMSVGIGGHINMCDADTDLSLAVRDAARREYAEEISIPQTYSDGLALFGDLTLLPKGLLYAGSMQHTADDNHVNDVHFGAIYTVNINKERAPLTDLKEEGKKLGWIPHYELVECIDNLETWSQIVVSACL